MFLSDCRRNPLSQREKVRVREKFGDSSEMLTQNWLRKRRSFEKKCRMSSIP